MPDPPAGAKMRLALLSDTHGNAWALEAVLADVRRRLPTRLAAGEQLQGRCAFRKLLEAGAVDVVMPDVKWVGGFGEARDICAMASAWGVEASPHNLSGPVATAASAQLAAVTPNCRLLEYCWEENACRAELVCGSEAVVAGAVRVDDRPGLGVDWDPVAARRYAVPD